MQIAHLFANRRLQVWGRKLRRALAAVPATALLLCSSGATLDDKVPAVAALGRPASPPPPARDFEILDLRKSQGIDLRPARNGQVLWIDLQADEYLKLTFEQKEVDLEISVFAPSGELLFKVDNPNGSWGPESVPLVGEQAGRYRLEITGSGRGSYRLATMRRRKAQNQDRQCVLAAGAYFRGRQFTNASQFAKAEEEFQSSRRLWHVCGYSLGEADAIYKIGDVQERSRNWAQALESFSGALPIYRRLKSPRMQALVLSEEGLIYGEHLGKFAAAMTADEESLNISRKHGFSDLAATVLTNRSKLRGDAGDPSGGLQDAETALPLARAAGNVEEEVKAENLMGRMYLLLGEAEEALRHHRQAQQRLGKEPDVKPLAATLVHFGDAYRALHNWDQAITSYLQGIGLWRRIGNAGEEATALNNLAIVYSQTGRWDEARDTLRRVREIYAQLNDRSGTAVASINLAWILGPMGRYEEALGLYREALEIFKEQSLKPDQAVAYFGMAWVEKKRGNLNEARRLLEQALTIVEDIRARAESRSLWTKFLVGWQGFYSLMVEILMEQHQREPARGFDLHAFAASERARCRTLLESVEGKIALPAMSWTELQKTLDKDTILLEYSLGEERSFLWVVTTDSLNSYVLPGRDKIEALARELHRLFAKGRQSKNRQIAIRRASELSQILFGQVASRLNRKRLLIVAPPELQYVSFAALPELPVSTRAHALWPTPWLNRFEIIVEPSATFLSTLRRIRAGRSPAPDLLALVGNPLNLNPKGERLKGADRGRSFAPLKFSRKEILAIAREARGRATCFLGREASPGLVLQGRLKSFKMLHFSVHGLLVTNDPQESALVLSSYDQNGKEIENRLRAREIAKLDLPSDLVVLSACNTGLGTEIRGEGLVGLTQAFFSAGASSIVASLWDVDDLGTSELMTQFYNNLLQKKLSPSAALREAQLTLWQQKQWSSPYFWSGFVLQGEWR